MLSDGKLRQLTASIQLTLRRSIDKDKRDVLTTFEYIDEVLKGK